MLVRYGLLVGILAAPPAAIAQLAPARAEFHVNTYTTRYQGYLGMAGDATGGFVVVWMGYGGQDGDSTRGDLRPTDAR
jgi:hypothetical protein